MGDQAPPKKTVRKFINACIWGDVELCTQMLRGDPDPDDPTADELTVEQLRHQQNLNKNLWHGVPVDVQLYDLHGCTGLMVAACNGHVEIVSLLLELGASQAMRDMRGWTALMYASSSGQWAIIAFLLDWHREAVILTPRTLRRRQSPGKFGDDGMYTPRSALKKALRGQKYRDVVDAREGNGWSALMFALRTGYEMVVDALLERGASTKNVTNDGKTTLMIAAANGNARLVKRMLKRKGNINFLDKSGWTALRYAVSNNRRDITKILIDEGADPDVPDKRGATCLHIAVEAGNPDVFDLLVTRSNVLREEKARATELATAMVADEAGWKKTRVHRGVKRVEGGGAGGVGVAAYVLCTGPGTLALEVTAYDSASGQSAEVARYGVAECAAFGLLGLFPGYDHPDSKPQALSPSPSLNRKGVVERTGLDADDLDLTHVITNLMETKFSADGAASPPIVGRNTVDSPYHRRPTETPLGVARRRLMELVVVARGKGVKEGKLLVKIARELTEDWKLLVTAVHKRLFRLVDAVLKSVHPPLLEQYKVVHPEVIPRPPLGELEYRLQRAIRKNKIDTVWDCVREGADINQVDPEYGRTAVHWAMVMRDAEYAFAIFSSKGYEPNLSVQDDEGSTPLHIAMRNENEHLANMLVARNSPLRQYDRKRIAGVFAGTELAARRMEHKNHVVFAAQFSLPPAPNIPYLIASNHSSITIKWTVPHPIVHLKTPEMAVDLVPKIESYEIQVMVSAPLTWRGKRGHSVPYLERQSGKRGPRSVRQRFGSWLRWNTVGESSDMHGTIKGLQAGMRHLCKVRAYNENGWGAFSEVVVLDTPPAGTNEAAGAEAAVPLEDMYDDEELDNYPRSKPANVTGEESIHVAAKLGLADVVRRRVYENITRVNARNANGMTPLHLAVTHGRKDIVVFLVRNGADPMERNCRRMTAFDLAKAHDEIFLPAKIQTRMFHVKLRTTPYRSVEEWNEMRALILNKAKPVSLKPNHGIRLFALLGALYGSYIHRSKTQHRVGMRCGEYQFLVVFRSAVYQNQRNWSGSVYRHYNEFRERVYYNHLRGWKASANASREQRKGDAQDEARERAMRRPGQHHANRALPSLFGVFPNIDQEREMIMHFGKRIAHGKHYWTPLKSVTVWGGMFKGKKVSRGVRRTHEHLWTGIEEPGVVYECFGPGKRTYRVHRGVFQGQAVSGGFAKTVLHPGKPVVALEDRAVRDKFTIVANGILTGKKQDVVLLAVEETVEYDMSTEASLNEFSKARPVFIDVRTYRLKVTVAKPFAIDIDRKAILNAGMVMPASMDAPRLKWWQKLRRSANIFLDRKTRGFPAVSHCPLLNPRKVKRVHGGIFKGQSVCHSNMSMRFWERQELRRPSIRVHFGVFKGKRIVGQWRRPKTKTKTYVRVNQGFFHAPWMLSATPLPVHPSSGSFKTHRFRKNPFDATAAKRVEQKYEYFFNVALTNTDEPTVEALDAPGASPGKKKPAGEKPAPSLPPPAMGGAEGVNAGPEGEEKGSDEEKTDKGLGQKRRVVPEAKSKPLQHRLVEMGWWSAASTGDVRHLTRVINEPEFETSVKKKELMSSTNAHGMTALHVACVTGHKNVAVYLLREGADPLQLTPLGEDSFTIAKRYDLSSKSKVSLANILEAVVKAVKAEPQEVQKPKVKKGKKNRGKNKGKRRT